MNTIEDLLIKELTRYRQHSGKNNINQHLSKLDGIENIEKLTISDIDVIAIIAEFPDTRSKDLLEYTNLGQSAISKITNKLVKYQFIEKYNRNDNRKDAYLKLTEQGKTVAAVHEMYHREKDIKLRKIIHNYSSEELVRFTSLLLEINNQRE